MRARDGLVATLDAEDCLHSLPKQLAAVGQLVRLSSGHDEPLGADETRGVCDLLYVMELQARLVVDAYGDMPLPRRAQR